MDPDVVYTKTARGLDEIKWRRHKLPARLRALLITIDGKATAAALVRRFSSPAQAAAGIAGLLACGFIEVAAPAGGGVSADALRAAKQFMLNSMLATLGPDADYFAASIDSARSREELSGPGVGVTRRGARQRPRQRCRCLHRRTSRLRHRPQR
jgi:hypothetical protein